MKYISKKAKIEAEEFLRESLEYSKEELQEARNNGDLRLVAFAFQEERRLMRLRKVDLVREATEHFLVKINTEWDKESIVEEISREALFCF